MTKRDKLIERFLKQPVDFSWQELERLLSALGYQLVGSGKTAGSRARFLHAKFPPITLHKPHPKPILKRYQLEDILNLLKREGLL